MIPTFDRRPRLLGRAGQRASRSATGVFLAAAAAIAAASAAVPALAQASSTPSSSAASPSSDKADESFAFHAQFTLVDQGNLAFRSPYQGPNSLPGVAEGRETTDATVFVGVRPWAGGEVWINPEIDQGFGLADTFGLAGFPSGEAYKVGASTPYLKLPRLFLRQTIDLGGARQAVDADINQLAGPQTANRIVITVGKFSVTDLFDNNQYAHDPRHDFLNWTIADTGTFDYAADAWAYTYGAAAEWYQGDWTARAGVFNLSVAPNSPTLEDNFSQYQVDAELERRYRLFQRPGKIAVTGFWTRGRMGSYDAAIALSQATGQPADIAAVRHYQGRFGIGLNLEQEITDDLGIFARAGVADGRIEAFEFTDVDQTAAAGLSLKGRRWSRADDTLGAAVVVNGISRIHQEFLNDGGTGILVGDGKLPHPGPEGILETYYDVAVSNLVHCTLDYQFVNNPAYNRDRGPVSILAARLHLQI